METMKRKINTGIIIISDRAAVGERQDETLPVLIETLPENEFEITQSIVIPDDFNEILYNLKALAESCDLILTSGGTGLSSRDVTPEATLAVSEKQVPGISEFLRYQSLQKTNFASLSRGVSVIRKNCLIVNLPGSPKGSKEYVEWLLPLLPHAIIQLTEPRIQDVEHKKGNKK